MGKSAQVRVAFMILVAGLAAAGAADSASAAVSTAPLPVLGDTVPRACNGTWDGQPFWARLLPRDHAYGNHRVLQVVYAPPAAADLGGINLSDCPFVLLDDHAEVVAWNGRDTESQVLPGVGGYRVTREAAVSATTAAVTASHRTIPGERGFDLHLAPLELAFAWHPGDHVHVRVVDLFGTRAGEAMAADWEGTRAVIAGAPVTVEPDGDGRLHRLIAADGHDLLVITRWIIGGPDAASASAAAATTGAATAAAPAGTATGAAP